MLDQQWVLAQVVFRATELLGLIRHLSADFCAAMIESTKVGIRGYGETVAAKTKSPSATYSHRPGSGEAACSLSAVNELTVFCMRHVTWTLNQIWRHSLVQRTS